MIGLLKEVCEQMLAIHLADFQAFLWECYDGVLLGGESGEVVAQEYVEWRVGREREKGERLPYFPSSSYTGVQC